MTSSKSNNPTLSLPHETSTSLYLLGLLLKCAECISTGDLAGAGDILPEIFELSTPWGSPADRVAAFFADALHARLLLLLLPTSLQPSPTPPLKTLETTTTTNFKENTFLARSGESRRRQSSLETLETTTNSCENTFLAQSGGSQLFLHELEFIEKLIPADLETLTLVSQIRKFHSAMQYYNSITPMVKFSHFTANQAIYEALEGHDRVHVVDLDIMQGLQWPGLFHILASSRPGLLSVRVTGFGPCSESLSQTGKRLGEFAASLGLPFEFNPVQGRIGDLSDLGRVAGRPEEVTVVHWMQHGLYDITGSGVGTLRVLSWLRPRLVTMVDQDVGQSQRGTFLERFVEALHYYSALFDALGEGDKDDLLRHQVEQQLLGCEIRNVLAVGGPKRSVHNWRTELMRAEFRPVSLAGSPATQAGLLLGMFPWRKGYTLMEDNGCLRLGWKDLPLLTASAWQPASCHFNSTTAGK